MCAECKGRQSFYANGLLRLEYPGAVYHGVNRGGCREEILRDDPDR
jgi:hypothetical protein